MEPGGTFEYVARLGDALRLGGFLVSPAEIEAHLETAKGVAAAQVVGVETDSGPGCCAFVVLEGASRGRDHGTMEAQLKAFCAQALAKFKVPRRIFILDAFPTTPSANGTKIQKAKLREQAQQRLNASSHDDKRRAEQ